MKSFVSTNHIFHVFTLLRLYSKWPLIISNTFPFYYQKFFCGLILCLGINWYNSVGVDVIFLIHRRNLAEGMKRGKWTEMLDTYLIHQLTFYIEFPLNSLVAQSVLLQVSGVLFQTPLGCWIWGRGPQPQCKPSWHRSLTRAQFSLDCFVHWCIPNT